MLNKPSNKNKLVEIGKVFKIQYLNTTEIKLKERFPSIF